MEKIELVITDLDGTIVIDDHESGRDDYDALRSLQNQDIQLTIATGRSYSSAKEFAISLGIEKNLNILVCNNGAVVTPADHFEPFFIEEIEKNLVVDLFNFCQKNKICLFLFDPEGEVVLWNTVENPSNFWRETKEPLWKNVQKINSVDDFINTIIVHLMVIVNEKENEVNIEYFKDFKKNFSFDTSKIKDAIFYELNKKGISKATGIKYLLDKINISKENVVAFGDGINDVQLFEYVGYPVAMENACEELKAKANYITLSVEEKGVSNFINYNLLELISE